MFPKQTAPQKIVWIQCTIPQRTTTTVVPRRFNTTKVVVHNPSTTTGRCRYVVEQRRRGHVTTDRRFDTNPPSGICVATSNYDEHFPGYAARARGKVTVFLFEQRRGGEWCNGA